MAVFNAAKREIDIKIVYYGPALCGKTTNVQCVHKMLSPTQRGDIMSLATKDDRTLFFDFLPIELGDVKGFKTRFHVYTVPGQVYYALTRRAVLTGVDGVVFVADSQASKLEENIESLQDLNENLNYYKKDLSSIPFIMQYNKRDMENILPVSELNNKINTNNVPYFASSAVDGTGVIETLTACCKLVFKQMDSTGSAKKRRRQQQDEAAPLPPTVPIKSEPLPPVATRPISPPLNFDDDDGPVIKIISDDDYNTTLKTPGLTAEPSLSSFDRATAETKSNARKSGTGFSALDDLPVMDSLSSGKLSPAGYESSEPEDESIPSLDVFKTSVPSPDLFPFDRSGSKTVQDADRYSLSAFDEKPKPQIPQDSRSAMPLDRSDVSELKRTTVASDNVCMVTECGLPQKISNKALNVPLTFQNKRTGQMFTVTVTVSFDDFSIT